MIVAVTGLMRSGTSAVAEILHRLGAPCAIHTPAPMPPTWRFDWEDSRLSARLMDASEVPAEWFVDYLAQRLDHAERCHFSQTVTLKSPLLAFSRAELGFAAEMLDVPIAWVIVNRDEARVAASMTQWEALDPQVNAAIALELSKPEWSDADTIEYERLVDDPAVHVHSLAQSLGLSSDPEDIQAAIDGVKEPTTGTEVLV
jgi:hypothetical protein